MAAGDCDSHLPTERLDYRNGTAWPPTQPHNCLDADVLAAMVQFLYDKTQQPDGSFPRDSLLNGRSPRTRSGWWKSTRTPTRC